MLAFEELNGEGSDTAPGTLSARPPTIRLHKDCRSAMLGSRYDLSFFFSFFLAYLFFFSSNLYLGWVSWVAYGVVG